MMRRLLLALLLMDSTVAQADTPLALSQTYFGRLNVTGAHASLRTHNDNSKPCWVTTSGTAQITGIPTGATIVSAKLYWAGSRAASDDYQITFNGSTRNATGQYVATDNVGSNYFSGAVDITADVTAKRNANYAFSNLTINNGDPHCSQETVMGGIQMLVIYSTTTETYRKLTVYDGFQFMRNSGADFTQTGISVPNTATAVVGHISWGGTSLIDSGENLRLNGVAQTDGKNHAGELFSSKSNIGGGGNVYGMDFDVFSSSSLTAGQTSATARIETGADGVFVSAVVLATPIVNADLAITKVRNNALALNSTATYTLSVSNVGPDAEPGSIQVIDTLPAGLTYQTATGSGWTCGASGQVVTCTRAGTLASGATASPITVTVKVTSGGTMVNTATVTGVAYDPTPANNTATDSGAVATADLTIAKALTGSLTVGQNATYTLTVKNEGPDTEPGPITVIDTLPAGLTFVSASGTGWVCSVNGQTVTCTRAGALAASATAGVISIVVNVTTGGSKKNTATASGTGYDPTPATGSHDGVAGNPVAFGYVLTDKPCASGVPFDTTGQCAMYEWGSTIAGSLVPLYVTAVNNNVPTAQSASPTTVSIGFALTCHNPTTSNGVNATFANASLGTCASASDPASYQPINISFAADSPSSSQYNFQYNDVGRIQFFMRFGAVVTEGAEFMSQPMSIKLTGIKAGAVGNPGNAEADGPVFITAGTEFEMSVGAYTETGSSAKNFGREIAPESFVLLQEAATTGLGFSMTLPKLLGAFGEIVNGVATGTDFNWAEVGSFKLTPSVMDLVAKKSIYSPVKLEVATIGRFIPDHFVTEVTGPMACATAMKCVPLTTAAYSGQPFTVKVIARNKKGATTENYQQLLARSVTLSAWNEAGGTVQNPSWTLPADPATFKDNKLSTGSFEKGVGTGAPVYGLKNVYATAAPRANDWTAPTSIFIRASEDAGGDSVSSKVALPGASVEGGVRILAGRLQVANTHGSERLKLSVPLTAQYWTGTAWVTSATDTETVSQIVKTGAMSFSNCQKKLSVNGSCAAALSGVADQDPAYLVTGRTLLILNAPNLTGWADAKMDNPTWLPSTVGRIHFGTYRSPLLYVREVF